MVDVKTWLGMAAAMVVTACTHQPASQADPELLGSLMQNSWRIESIAAGGVIDYSPAQLTFAADGTFSGNGTCNRIFGDYKLEGALLSIAQNIAATRMACPEALMNQEQKLLQVLPGTHKVVLDNAILTLTNSAGKEVIKAAATAP
ncbi:META domain-containing protein [Gilvimarinus sp. DA14]|uniref:META domain-containing protein n=1 Tax=Gilvimarinus sp. DA14 TaxID=2956798 RepID=UPI0020B8D45D|nr:META domain-containing protein [Gilvimarinus sp. DA14]UTF60563.1 META domain-containing protein [Gilvimarinus sp. DA14]